MVNSELRFLFNILYDALLKVLNQYNMLFLLIGPFPESFYLVQISFITLELE